VEDKLFDDIRLHLIDSGKETKAPSMGEDFEGKLLTAEQLSAIIIALANARGDKGFTEEELIKLVHWCELQIIGESIVSMMLKGYVYIDDPTGEFTGDTVITTLTPLGREALKKLT